MLDQVQIIDKLLSLQGTFAIPLTNRVSTLFKVKLFN